MKTNEKPSWWVNKIFIQVYFQKRHTHNLDAVCKGMAICVLYLKV